MLSTFERVHSCHGLVITISRRVTMPLVLSVHLFGAFMPWLGHNDLQACDNAFGFVCPFVWCIHAMAWS